jgi:hypothetical protein
MAITREETEQVVKALTELAITQKEHNTIMQETNKLLLQILNQLKVK